MAVTIDGTTGVSAVQSGAVQAGDLATGAVTASAMGIQTGRRNLIINGAMQVAQRATSKNITGNGYHTVDRFQSLGLSSMSFDVTASQDTDGPVGFKNSLKLLVNTAQTPTGGENFTLRYGLEGQDVSQLEYGTADAKKVTLSFYVKSNKTGTYSIAIYAPNGLGTTHMTLVSYTIDVANTWERKTITLNGNTGAVNYDGTTAGLILDWQLSVGPDDILDPFDWTQLYAGRAATGQVNLLDTINNYWNITGVQLEVGDAATPFEHRSYAEELIASQRYFETNYPQGNVLGDVMGNSLAYGIAYRATSATTNYASFGFKVKKRTTPTVTIYNGVTGASGTWRGSSSTDQTISPSPNTDSLNINGPANGDFVRSGFYAADSEL